MTFIRDLEPGALWAHFDEILTIPRGSKNEDKIRQFIVDLAESQGLEYQVDTTGNVVISKPASDGKEQCPITILQSHMDMVQEKNSDVDHDFDTDPIEPQQDGEWINGENIFDVNIYGRINTQQHDEIWCDHVDGAMVLWCDGGVTLLAADADSTVLRSICTRAGQETEKVASQR